MKIILTLLLLISSSYSLAQLVDNLGDSKILYTLADTTVHGSCNCKYDTSIREEMKIFFDGQFDEKDMFSFVIINYKGRQTIYIHKDRMHLLALKFEQALKKAIEYDSIARVNNVNKLNKKLDIKFKTSGGSIKDVNFKTCDASVGAFKVEIFKSARDNKLVTYVEFEVFQTESVYSAFWNGMKFNVSKSIEINKAKSLISVLRNSKKLADEIRKDSKEELFK